MPICKACWLIENGDLRPVRVAQSMRNFEACYRCKQITHYGIYVRRMIETPTEKGNQS